MTSDAQSALPTPTAPERLPDAAPVPVAASPLVQVVQAIEGNAALDRWGGVLGDLSSPLARSEAVLRLLQGRGTGHALHPALTDLPLGLWTSTVVLDLVGGRSSREAAQKLLGAGLAAAVPTAVTGLAEWRETSRPESRVGAVHAGLNSVGLTLYAASYLARRRGRHGLGRALALGASAASGAAGYLGGHLALARKVATRDAELRVDGVGPELRRPQERRATVDGSSVT